MKKYALDTGSFMLYFAGDELMRKIYSEVKKGVSSAFTLETNLAELYYKTCQKLGEETARIRDLSIRKSLIEVRKIDERISMKAGKIKCNVRDISLADALLAAAAKLFKAIVVTTDEDFRKIEGLKTIILKID
ncbi:MAG: DNA-binding protein [Thermoprotei archaeon]|nr:MAG: DNA-binding protein [Thermoprotei archaeon]